MGYKYTGDSMLGVSLNVATPKPLDIRTVVDKVEDLYSINSGTAYNGMTVAVILNGNIYMLVDKNHISDKIGWKASYESILIITCTLEEYKEWSNNTTEDFLPVDPGKDYLHQDTYYYIYEDSLDEETLDLEYLSASWGKLIEEQLKDKALNSTVLALLTKVEEDVTNLETNYLTKDLVENTYLPLSELDTDVPGSKINNILSDYYNKEEVDDTFVTKESLRGEGMEGDDFVFVTKTEYDKDLEIVNLELLNSVKSNSEALLTCLTVPLLKSPDGTVLIDLLESKALLNSEEIAIDKNVPKILVLSESNYEELKSNTSEEFTPIDPEKPCLNKDTYYYLYPDQDEPANSYITKEYLENNYSTTNLYQLWVTQNFYKKDLVDTLISLLTSRIEALESLIQSLV